MKFFPSDLSPVPIHIHRDESMLALRTATLRLGARRAALPASGVSARGLAAKADHSPPLKLFGIPARYANATYVAASKAGMLPQVETELLGFQALMKKNSTIKDYLTSPTVQRSEQVATIEKLFSGPKKVRSTNQSCPPRVEKQAPAGRGRAGRVPPADPSPDASSTLEPGSAQPPTLSTLTRETRRTIPLKI
jgi:hypothetical protein